MGGRVSQETVISSQIYGDIVVAGDQLYSFEKGIIGFSNTTQFALMPYEDSQFYVLHACTEELSFILLPAMLLEKELSFQIDSESVKFLGVSQADEIVTFLIVHFVDDLPYVNTKAPILIVPSTQKGCQYVINDGAYAVRESLVLKDSALC